MSAGSGASPFSGRMIAGLILVGLAATAALLLIVAFGSPSASKRDGRGHALSVSATGFKGLLTLSQRLNQAETAENSDQLAAAGLVIVTIELQSSREDIERLLELRRGLPTLLILPKWMTAPDPAHRGWVRAFMPAGGERGVDLIDAQLTANADLAERGGGTAQGQALLAGLAVREPSAPQTVSGPNLRPVLSVPGRGALIAQRGNEPHYIAADPDLFNNHGLKQPAAAQAALAILARLQAAHGGTIAFDLTVPGLDGSGPNLIRTALEPPFLPMTLALAVAAILAGLHGAFRFGQARREARAIAFGKAALVENSAGLIKLAKREARLGGAYAEVVRQDAARLTGAPPALQGEALDAYLDRLSRDGPEFSLLANNLAAADTRSGLVDAARALFQWKKDIIR